MIKSISSEQKREILLFLIKLSAIYIVWRLFSFFIGYQSQPIEDRTWPWLSIQWERFNDVLRWVLLRVSQISLRAVGYDAFIYGKYILYAKGYPGVGVGNYCLGMQLMVLYVALIISIRKPFKIKLVAIPMGLVIIQLLNVLRIAGLCVLVIYYPAYVNYSHDYVFNVIVVVAIIYLYYRVLKWKW